MEISAFRKFYNIMVAALWLEYVYFSEVKRWTELVSYLFKVGLYTFSPLRPAVGNYSVISTS